MPPGPADPRTVGRDFPGRGERRHGNAALHGGNSPATTCEPRWPMGQKSRASASSPCPWPREVQARREHREPRQQLHIRHARGSGHPVAQGLDSRFRGNDVDQRPSAKDCRPTSHAHQSHRPRQSNSGRNAAAEHSDDGVQGRLNFRRTTASSPKSLSKVMRIRFSR